MTTAGRLALLAVAVTAAGCGSGAVHGLEPARFPQRAGWQVGAGHVHACPGTAVDRCAQAGSWATTGEWRDCTECLPQRTVAALPGDGIAITLVVGRGPHAPRRALRWPPRLRPSEAGSLEGLPARIGVVRAAGRVHGFTTYLFVFFGRPRPTAAQAARAEAELAAVELP
ncbi:MAG TPA: hypothetical protein VLD16_06455 [Gaiellaceae bacterium]|nr:hypothetical protein [Gaiellaceae bacterium]